MYLYKSIYVGAKYEHRNVKLDVELTVNGKSVPIDISRVSTIEVDFGYWRKANHIHKWFVDNVQEGNDDCKKYYVSADQLNELLELCREVKVLYEAKEYDKVSELLPPCEGFFFGGTEVDEYYYQDILDTIGMLEKLSDGDYDFYYQSSW